MAAVPGLLWTTGSGAPVDAGTGGPRLIGFSFFVLSDGSGEGEMLPRGADVSWCTASGGSFVWVALTAADRAVAPTAAAETVSIPITARPAATTK